MGIRDRLIAAPSPWQNGHVERLVGSIHRECLDNVIVFGEDHLHRILKSYTDYHNRVQTRLSLDKDTPIHRPTDRTVAIPILGGLHHYYVRILFLVGTGGAFDGIVLSGIVVAYLA